jgi:hypothetical protein
LPEEEDLPFSRLFQPFPDATKTNSDFCNLNLQTIQALKGKSNPKQAHPKCKCNSSSSITQKIFLEARTLKESLLVLATKNCSQPLVTLSSVALFSFLKEFGAVKVADILKAKLN